MLVGYARVSTVDQDTALQLEALRHAGITRIFSEKRSGVAARPELGRLLWCLRRGDVVVVYKVDRLARSLSDLLRLLSTFERMGVGFRSLTEPLDTSSPVGRMMLQILGSFAEFERSMIRERCMAGRAAAVARGVRFGRPRKIDVESLPALVDAGLTLSEIASRFDCDRRSVKSWLDHLGLKARRKLRQRER